MTEAKTAKRCRWAILFGLTLHTRCGKAAGHLERGDGAHEGRGLARFADQSVMWLPGDRREYETRRTDTHAWEGAAAVATFREFLADAERAEAGEITAAEFAAWWGPYARGEFAGPSGQRP